MNLRPARLRAGEWLAGTAAAALLVLMLAVDWYGAHGATRALTGWQALSHLRWLALATIAAALALAWFQAACRAPALPSVLSVIATVLALGTTIWMIYRVLIQAPAGEHPVAILGPVCAALILVGAFLSLRQEGIRPEDGPQQIPLVELPAIQSRAEAPD